MSSPAIATLPTARNPLLPRMAGFARAILAGSARTATSTSGGRKNEAILLPGGKKIVPEALEAQYAASPAIGEIAILVEAGKLVGIVVPSPSARGKWEPRSRSS